MTWLGFRFGPRVLADVQGGLRWLLLAAVMVAMGVLGVRWMRRRAAVRATRVVQAPEGEA